MRAWLLPEFTGIDKLRLAADAADPAPAAGEVVLDVLFAALNPADRYLAEALYPAKPPLPHVLGRDGVGVVSAVGAGVADVKVGDRLAILRGETGVNRAGTLAQRVTVRAEELIPVPAGWSLEQAAAAPLVYLTAYQALTMWADLPAGAVVLVTGASGGVGVASVQLAKAMGHTVVAQSRDARKAGQLKALGADVTLDPQAPDWRKQLKAAMAGRRVDLAIDNIGGKLLSEVIDTLGHNGRVSCVGALAGPVPNFNTPALFFRRIKLGGVSVGDYGPAHGKRAWGEVLSLLDKAGARPLVDRVFPFEQVPAAFARLKEGPMGKVVVRVGG
jgi:NADPH2:quinone reductase